MTFVFFIFMVIIILIFVFTVLKATKRRGLADSYRRRPQSAPARPVYGELPPSQGLGLQPGIPLEPALNRLEESLSPEFIQQLKSRVMSRHPRMSSAEFDWKLLELKRYFLMTAVLRDVPMFSEAVDEIWHEMLMFTREYSRLGDHLMGSVIHHAPHTGGAPDPGGRAWFDWVYAHLFAATPYSGRIWGSFFRHPLDAGRLSILRSSDERTLADQWFNTRAASRFPEVNETIRELIRLARLQAQQAGTDRTYETERPEPHTPGFMTYLAGAMLFYSVAAPEDFGQQMEEHFPEEEAQKREQEQNAASTSSGCSASGCGGGFLDDRDHSGDGGGSDSGSDSSSDGGSSSSCSSSSCSSSSCSSSSCGSGCGGGGD